jgi:hypothetical protein
MLPSEVELVNAVMERIDRAQPDPLPTIDRDADRPAVAPVGRTPRALPAPGRISGRMGWLVAAAWAAFVLGVYAFEPAPADPDAAIPAWEVMAALGFLWVVPAALVGLARRRRWGLQLSAAGAAFGFLLAVGCLATGHHAGMAPWTEMAGMVLLGGLSWAGLRRSPRAR